MANRVVGWAFGRSVGSSVGQLVGGQSWSVGWSAGLTDGSLIIWAVCPVVGWFTIRLGWLVGSCRLVGWLTGWLKLMVNSVARQVFRISIHTSLYVLSARLKVNYIMYPSPYICQSSTL